MINLNLKHSFRHISYLGVLRLLLPGWFVLAVVFICPALVQAQSDIWSVRGHLKYQPTVRIYKSDDINAVLGPDVVLSHEIDTRLVSEARQGPFTLSIDAELLGLGGNGFEARERIAEQNPFGQGQFQLINDDRRILDLTAEILDQDDAAAVLRLDRAAFGWSRDEVVFRAGRQAISWGNGLVFSVFDLFNPFSPIEIDKDYKTGDDMLYGQLLWPWDGDTQVLAVGRRDIESESIMARESSFPIKWHERIEPLETDVDLLAARHYDENVFGFGVSRVVWEAVVRSDLTVTETKSHSWVFSAVVNADYSWVLFNKNFYGYVEYFRNGFGIGDGDYSSLSTELESRISRGELFTIGRDNLALGTSVELSALLNWYNNLIFNLHDESGMVQQRVVYEITQNTLLNAGMNIAYGPRGSEYGGLAFGGEEVFLSSGTAFFTRVAYHF